jgi:hypothetical protein
MEGDIYWDGMSDDKQQLPAGPYILLARSFDLDGGEKIFRKSVVITRNLVSSK